MLLIGSPLARCWKGGWAPVAITGALLVSLGFKPLYAAGLLIANTAPVAFGALGVPILVAGQVTESIRSTLAQWRDVSYRSRQFQPFWLVAMMDGWKGEETWPAALVAGEASLSRGSLPPNYIGPEPPDITGAGEYRPPLYSLKSGGRKNTERQSAWTIPRCDGRINHLLAVPSFRI